jgi:enediyne biosynthesis protein E4
MKFHSVLIFLFCFFIACSHKQQIPLFELQNSTGIDFVNTVKDGKLENSFYFRNYYNGGGVAAGDINNDGLCDVLLSSNMGENKLYLNRGGFVFTDITAGSGMRQDSMWSTGVIMADINSDGWLDIYVCNSGHMKDGNRRNKLYINNHDLTFTEAAAQYGLNISAYTTQVSFFDYDLDGDLDCFMINNSPMPINNLGYTNKRDLPAAQWPVAAFLKGGGDHLYRNDNGHYTEVTATAGIHGTLISFGLGVSVGDLNNDGFPDVYVANDSYERDYLYINQQNGTFKDEMEDRMEQNSFSSMGADIADINNDGYPDLFATDMLPGDDYRLKTLGSFDNIDLYNKRIQVGLYRQFMKNCLYVNNKNGRFLETANYSGVSGTDWSWGALFFDADNDGYNDIYVCNGINHDVTNLDFMDFFANDVVQNMIVSGQKQNLDSVLSHIPVHPLPNKAFKNNGNLTFTDAGTTWGFTGPSFSNGAAYADLDNDGDLDLVVNNENQAAFVYRNNSREQNGNNYIGVLLKGRGQNRGAIGSKIKVYHGGEVFYREVVPGRGFQSSVDYKQIIGLGKLQEVDSLIVVWPDRSYSKYEHPAVNKVHTLEQPLQGLAGGYLSVSPVLGNPLLEPVATGMERHQEDDYIDFYYERNLPEMLSREGPGMAVADVNGDGLEDVYMGGGKGQSGQLYLQNTGGGFDKKEEAIFKQYAGSEDVAVLFFDADHDGDMDMFIGAGGNNAEAGSVEIEHRLYKNDGHGNFSIDTQAFPTNGMNTGVAVAYDYDGDGDEDLYVGSRSVPYNYGITPQSYLYNNDGKGHFTDVSAQYLPQLSMAGMITGAVWSDIDGDGNRELIIAGEWMSPRVFSYRKGKKQFEELKDTGLEGLNGWWQTISAGDIDGDGREDLVLGNIGENFYLHPDREHPVKLWLNDFDGNGTKEQFLTRSIGGKDMPVFLKREITEEFPGLKKQNLRNSDYAVKTVQELFGKEVMAKSAVKEFTESRSMIGWNMGGGKFRMEAMPVGEQLSSINAVLLTDVNGDGHVDMVTGGNKFTFPPQFGRLDAGYGQVLLNDGRGKLSETGERVSGMHVKEEIKAIRLVKTKTNRLILIARNNQLPVLYKIKR